MTPEYPVSQESQKVLSAIASLASQDADIEVVWLYGSRARQTEHSGSDYDFAVAFKNFQLSDFDKYTRPNELALTWSEVLGLGEEMVSVVDINQIPVYLAYNVVDHGIVVYQEKSSRAYREISRIYSMYEYQKREALKQTN